MTDLPPEHCKCGHRFMAHPMPGDFDTREAAEEFVGATGIRWLTVRQHQ